MNSSSKAVSISRPSKIKLTIVHSGCRVVVDYDATGNPETLYNRFKTVNELINPINK